MNNTLENLEVINILITNDKYRLDTIIEEEPKDKRLNNKLKDIYYCIEEIQQQLLTIAYVIKPHEDEEGHKYIMVKSDEGYSYAKSLK